MPKPFALRTRRFSGYKTVCQICGLCVNLCHNTPDHEPIWITKTTYRVLSFREQRLETTESDIKTYYKFVAAELESGLL